MNEEKTIDKYSIEDLEKEIYRRKLEKKQRKPLPTHEMNWEPVIACVEKGVRGLQVTGFEDEDFEHFIFEAVIETIYGEDNVWDWYNELLGDLDERDLLNGEE